MIVRLPHLKNEKVFYDRNKQKQFSIQRLFDNIEWLKATLGLDDPMVRYAYELVQEWKNDIPEAREFLWIEETLEKHIDIEGSYTERKAYGDCREIVTECLKSQTPAGSALLFLSGSHATTEIVLSSFKELNPGPCIGVVCFDAHADLYDSGEIPWKGNVFSILLKKGIVSSVLFVGVPMFRRINVSNGLSEELKKKVSFLDWKGTDKEIESALSEWSDSSPTHVFYSFDIDGLNSRKEKYTAMEYCSFHILTALAEKDLMAETDEDTLRNALRGCIMQPTENPNNPHVIDHKNLYGIGEDGIPLSDVAKTVQKINIHINKKCIQNGLPFFGKNLLVGDIVELFGPDFEGRTAKAAADIARIITECATIKNHNKYVGVDIFYKF